MPVWRNTCCGVIEVQKTMLMAIRIIALLFGVFYPFLNIHFLIKLICVLGLYFIGVVVSDKENKNSYVVYIYWIIGLLIGYTYKAFI